MNFHCWTVALGWTSYCRVDLQKPDKMKSDWLFKLVFFQIWLSLAGKDENKKCSQLTSFIKVHFYAKFWTKITPLNGHIIWFKTVEVRRVIWCNNSYTWKFLLPCFGPNGLTRFKGVILVQSFAKKIHRKKLVGFHAIFVLVIFWSTSTNFEKKKLKKNEFEN